MPEYRIEVIVDPRQAVTGSRRVREELEKTDKTADLLGKTLRRALGLIGVGALVRELGQLSDAYTNAQNRLRTVISDERELAETTRELFDTANDTRAAYEATAETYARVSLATKELGVSQEETLQFTRSLNQAIALSGASAAESQAGLIQLSQGLASGALRGDELRAVLEQLPAVADVIAKSLGVTRGELRQLGADGKITAEVVLGAFREAREELDERFAQSVPTLGQAFVVLRNHVLEYVGSANEAHGVSQTLARGIITLAENLDDVVTAAVAAGAAFLAIRFGPAAGEALAAAAAFTKARLALLQGRAVVLGSVTAAQQQAAAEVQAAAAIQAKTAAVLAQTQAEIAKAVVVTGSTEAVFIQAAVERQVVAAKAADAAASEALAAANLKLAAATKAASLQARIFSSTNLFAAASIGAAAFGFILKGIIDDLAEVEERTAKIVEQGRNLELTEFGKVGAQIEDTREKLRALEDQFDSGTNTSSVLVRQIEIQRAKLAELEQQQELLRNGSAQTTVQAQQQVEAMKALAASLDEVIAGIEQENTLLQLNAEERRVQAELLQQIARLEKEGGTKLDEGQKTRLEAAIRTNQALESRAEVLDRIKAPQARFENELAILNQLLATGAITQAEFNSELAEMASTLTGVDFTATNLAPFADQLKGIDVEGLRRLLEEMRATATPEPVPPPTTAPGQPSSFGSDASASLQLQHDLYLQIHGPQQQFLDTQTQLNVLLDQGAISATQYTVALNEAAIAANTLGSGLQSGVRAGLAQIENDLLNTGQQIEVALVRGFDSARESILDFVETGKFEIHDMVNGLLRDFGRLLLNQGFLALFGGGGATGLFGSIFGGARAEGGSVAAGRAYLVGEEGPELFMPRGSGNITPAGETYQRLASMTQSPTINVTAPPAIVNVTNVSDPNDIARGMESPSGEQAFLNLVSRFRRTLRGTIA